MPVFTDLSNLSLYYSGGSSSYNYLAGPYASHSSIVASNLHRPSQTYGSTGTRSFSRPINRGYKPLLATISETQCSSPRLGRINSPKLYHPSPKYKIQKPISINTADIDVSANRYLRNLERSTPGSPNSSVYSTSPPCASTDRPEKDDGVFMPRVDQNHRNTIKRGRTVVRLHTIRRGSSKTEDKMKKTANKNEEEVQPEDTNTKAEVATHKQKWRQNFEPEELKLEKRCKTKPLSERLVEKFLIKDRQKEEEAIRLLEEKQQKRAENLSNFTRKSSKRKSIKKTPSFHEICRDISSDKINEDLNPGNVHIRKKSSYDIMKAIRRNSAEVSQEESKILDDMLQREDMQADKADKQTDPTQAEKDAKTEEKATKRRKKYLKKASNESTTEPEKESVQYAIVRRKIVKKRTQSSELEKAIEAITPKEDKEAEFNAAEKKKEDKKIYRRQLTEHLDSLEEQQKDLPSRMGREPMEKTVDKQTNKINECKSEVAKKPSGLPASANQEKLTQPITSLTTETKTIKETSKIVDDQSAKKDETSKKTDEPKIKDTDSSSPAEKKPKPKISATVEIESRPNLKVVIDDIKVESVQTPTGSPTGRKFKYNVTVDVEEPNKVKPVTKKPDETSKEVVKMASNKDGKTIDQIKDNELPKKTEPIIPECKVKELPKDTNKEKNEIKQGDIVPMTILTDKPTNKIGTETQIATKNTDILEVKKDILPTVEKPQKPENLNILQKTMLTKIAGVNDTGQVSPPASPKRRNFMEPKQKLDSPKGSKSPELFSANKTVEEKRKAMHKQENLDELDGDFWAKIGKRETIYYKDRRKRLEEDRSKRMAEFWDCWIKEEKEEETKGEKVTASLSEGEPKQTLSKTVSVTEIPKLEAKSAEPIVEIKSEAQASTTVKLEPKLPSTQQNKVDEIKSSEKIKDEKPLPKDDKENKEFKPTNDLSKMSKDSGIASISCSRDSTDTTASENTKLKTELTPVEVKVTTDKALSKDETSPPPESPTSKVTAIKQKPADLVLTKAIQETAGPSSPKLGSPKVKTPPKPQSPISKVPPAKTEVKIKQKPADLVITKAVQETTESTKSPTKLESPKVKTPPAKQAKPLSPTTKVPTKTDVQTKKKPADLVIQDSVPPSSPITKTPDSPKIKTPKQTKPESPVDKIESKQEKPKVLEDKQKLKTTEEKIEKTLKKDQKTSLPKTDKSETITKGKQETETKKKVKIGMANISKDITEKNVTKQAGDQKPKKIKPKREEIVIGMVVAKEMKAIVKDVVVESHKPELDFIIKEKFDPVLKPNLDLVIPTVSQYKKEFKKDEVDTKEIENEKEKEPPFVPMKSNIIFLPGSKPKDDTPVVIMATPRDLRKRVQAHRKAPQLTKVPSESSDSDETSSEETSSDDSGSDEYDTNVVFQSGGQPIRKSTSSNDSGFDSSAPGSPATNRNRHTNGSSARYVSG